jgi:hypothetical protein
MVMGDVVGAGFGEDEAKAPLGLVRTITGPEVVAGP